MKNASKPEPSSEPDRKAATDALKDMGVLKIRPKPKPPKRGLG